MENPYDVLKITSVKMLYNKQTNKQKQEEKSRKKMFEHWNGIKEVRYPSIFWFGF